jgi:hypothetical protein
VQNQKKRNTEQHNVQGAHQPPPSLLHLSKETMANKILPITAQFLSTQTDTMFAFIYKIQSELNLVKNKTAERD